MADHRLTPANDNPALTDPTFTAAHEPRRYVMFAAQFTTEGELTLERTEGEPSVPAELIVQRVYNQNNFRDKSGIKSTDGSTTGKTADSE